MQATELAYTMLEVGGIQNYICRTGKLKEMIGGSEIIEFLSQEFCDKILQSLGLSTTKYPQSDSAGVLELQRNAGTLCLAMRPEASKAFLRAFSEAALERFPGLPLFGASAPFTWGKDGLREGRRAATEGIRRQRNERPVACGMLTLPVSAVARLDGLPAVEFDDSERISLPSTARRHPDMLRQARNRLQQIGKQFAEANGLTLVWEDDLNQLLGGEKQRVALIHMDGNDLGRQFGEAVKNAETLPPQEGVEHLCSLSRLVEKANKAAFKAGLEQVLLCELQRKDLQPDELTVPLRPLVLGGDDITVIVRADLALPFIHHFVRTFEQITANAQTPLSLGVGMAIMPANYPFVKAFSLVEDLLKNAKKSTMGLSPRPSSLDYLVISNDVETDLSVLRQRISTAADGCSLTTKPFTLKHGKLQNFIHDGMDVLQKLPRSHTRPAMNACRQGKDAARRNWEKLRANLHRGLGGRHGTDLMTVAQFEHLFPDGFFSDARTTAPDNDLDARVTALGDYLELEHLLPLSPGIRKYLSDELLKELEVPCA